MIPTSLYPTDPWPLTSIDRHPVVELMAVWMREATWEENAGLFGLFKVLEKIKENPDRFESGISVIEAFEGIKLDQYDFILTQLKKMRLLESRIDNGKNLLFPATKLDRNEKPKLRAFSYYLPIHLGEIIREEAKIRNMTMSRFIELAVTSLLASGTSSR